MKKHIHFEEISDGEKKLLLSAYGYSVDEEGNIMDALLNEKIKSNETGKFLTLKNTAFVQGSLKLIDADPLVISRYLREEIEKNET
jgi:hypothetical protein